MGVGVGGWVGGGGGGWVGGGGGLVLVGVGGWGWGGGTDHEESIHLKANRKSRP